MDVLNGSILDLTVLSEKTSDDVLDQSVDEPITEDVNIPVPGGLSERPSAHEVSGTKISIPSGTKIDAKTYNDAISALQRSFKEGAEMLEALQGMEIVERTDEEIQQEYLEEAMANGILMSCEEGAIFESVDRSDKEAVKKIVKKLRSKVEKDIKESGNHFRNVNMVTKTITAALAGSVYGAAQGAANGYLGGAVKDAANAFKTQMNGGSMLAGAQTSAVGSSVASGAIKGAVLGGIGGGLGASWTQRLWQVIGIFHSESGNVKTLVDGMNEKYKEDLGDYKLLYTPASGGLLDAFKQKFGWKNVKKVYWLMVDKKLPSEIKEIQKEINDAIDEK